MYLVLVFMGFCRQTPAQHGQYTQYDKNQHHLTATTLSRFPPAAAPSGPAYAVWTTSSIWMLDNQSQVIVVSNQTFLQGR